MSEMTSGHRAGWSRLQRISLHHASILPVRKCGTGYRRQIAVPEIIQDNVKILGRGTEEEIKARIMWYLEFYPSVFSGS
jgi:hypothetical protein